MSLLLEYSYISLIPRPLHKQAVKATLWYSGKTIFAARLKVNTHYLHKALLHVERIHIVIRLAGLNQVGKICYGTLEYYFPVDAGLFFKSFFCIIVVYSLNIIL